MRRFWIAFALLGALSIGSLLSQAQTVSNIVFAGGYVGPGNLGVTFTAWWGLRGYSTATTGGTTPVVDLVRNDGATCTAYVSGTGSVDFSVKKSCNGNTQTVDTWNAAGATVSCVSSTISGTTFTKGCASSILLNLGDKLTGTGVTTSPPTFLIAGSCTGANGPGSTCTVNQSQSVASTTITDSPYAMKVSKIYDQTQGNNCGGASCDLVEGTDSLRPSMLPSASCPGATLPCITMIQGSSALKGATNFTSGGTVASYTGVSGHNGSLASVIKANSIQNGIFGSGTSDYALGGSTGNFIVTANTSTHVLVGATQAGTNTSIFNVDGVETSGTTGAPGTGGGLPITLGSGSALSGYVTELGLLDGTFLTAGQRKTLCNNMRLYWGISGTC